MRLDNLQILAWAALFGTAHALALPAPTAAQDDVDWGYEGGGDGGGDAADDGDAGAAEGGLSLEAPGRVLARLGAGVGLRLGTDDQYDQSAVAPAYLEAMGGYVFAGSGRWRHGATLNVATNLVADGPASEETGPFAQYTFIASYMAYFRFGMDLVVGARLGPLIAIGSSDTPTGSKFDWSWGGELAGHVQYMLLAGFGLYVDLGVSVFAGAAETVHALAAVSGGVVIDYELLP